ncbi:MAG: sulfatase-like hydrolase/transferase, partial [Thermodesulfobacteriota bacterium]
MNANFLLIFSLTLFALSIFFYRRTNLKKINRGVFSLLIFTSVCLNISYAASDYFTANGIDNSVVYHIKYGLGGAGFSEYWGLIVSSAIMVILAIALSVWIFTSRANLNTNHRVYVFAAFIPAFISPLISPATSDLYNIFLSQNTVEATIEATDEEFYKYYTTPSIERTSETKNLVFIYAESLEHTYFDNDLFPGLIKELNNIESTTTYFTNIEQVMGTKWTMAGMVSSQCGIPLVTASHGNSMSGMDEFLPSAVCLGDLLKDEGYHLSYYGGADLEFAGKGKFFTTHKFDEVKGKDQLMPMVVPQSYKSAWGLFDDALFNIAYSRFLDLSKNQKRFALFTLTLDTHHPKGHPSPVGCQGIRYQDGSNPMLNAVACSDHLIADLIKRIFQSPYGSKTIVVVASDTLAMRNTARNLLLKGDRKNLFMVIEPGLKKKSIIKKAGSTLDIGTTLLPFIGYKGEIGLGRDLTLKSSDFKYILDRLGAWRPYFANFWNFPKVRDHIEVNLSRKTIKIDKRTFKAPVLVKFDEDLQTTLLFEFNKAKVHKNLIDHARLLAEKNSAFLMVDSCTNISKLDASFGSTGGCIVVGKNGKYLNIRSISQPDADAMAINELVYKINSDDLRYFSGYTSASVFQTRRIAHAGGGISGKTYTNSYEALNENIKKGFKYFELDFNFTSDGHLVCIHDFTTKEKPTLEAFNSRVKNKSAFHNCTLTGLIEWMEQNPSAKIITDVKDNNLKALEIISKKVPDFKERVIPQVYDPSNYAVVRKMGYSQIIWTLYRYGGSKSEILEWVDN